MNDYKLPLQKSIESAQELIKLLNGITAERPLNSEQEKALRQDIESIQEITILMEQAQSKEQIRGVWNTFRNVKRNFGGYVGDETGNLLMASVENLWLS